MTSDDLTRQQLEAIQMKVAPALKYLDKLLSRMQQRSFPNDDPLWLAVFNARRELLTLVTELRCQASATRCAAKGTKPTDDGTGYRLGRPRKETH